MKRLLAVLSALLGVAVVGSPASAHPLGNFTVNTYAGIRVSPSSVDIDFVLDLAELPTVAERPATSDAAYANTECATLASQIALTVAGKAVALSAKPVALTFPTGMAGLATLRLECAMSAAAAIDRPTAIDVHNGAESGRIGWHEMTAVGDGLILTDSDTATASISRRLTSYPAGGVDGGLDERDAHLTVDTAGTAAVAVPSAIAAVPGADALTRWFTDLLGQRRLGLGLGVLLLVVAMVLGAGHALAPGHGKTVMAAYLVGRNGRRRQALAVAGTVTLTHTAGVLLRGLLIAASYAVAPQSLYRWLGVVNGLIIAAVGVTLLRRALRPSPPFGVHGGHGHSHEHGHHHHHHHGHHHHGDEHSHAAVAVLDPPETAAAPTPAAQTAPPSRRTIVAMGIAGGMTPSPSAVVVLLGAAALGRAWYGVLLVVAYGAGMAAALTGIGLLIARVGDRIVTLLDRRWGRVTGRWVPILAATAVLGAGLTAVLMSLLR